MPDALEGGAAPGEQRADAGQEEQKEADGQRDAVKERCADSDPVALYVFRNDGEQGAPQNGEAGSQKHQIVEQETGFTGNERLQLVLRLEMIALAQKRKQADGEDENQETGKPVADRRLREGVHGADQAGARQVGAQDAQHEGAED